MDCELSNISRRQSLDHLVELLEESLFSASLGSNDHSIPWRPI
jgi:hypothetical protein